MACSCFTSVVASHPVGSLQVGDLPSDQVGEDPDPLVVVELLEDLLVPGVKESSFKVKNYSFNQVYFYEDKIRSLNYSQLSFKGCLANDISPRVPIFRYSEPI